MSFLYGFVKAVRRAARAANSARSPQLPLALPLRRRLAPVGWRKKQKTPDRHWLYGSHPGAALRLVSRNWQLSGAGVLPERGIGRDLSPRLWHGSAARGEEMGEYRFRIRERSIHGCVTPPGRAN